MHVQSYYFFVTNLLFIFLDVVATVAFVDAKSP